MVQIIESLVNLKEFDIRTIVFCAGKFRAFSIEQALLLVFQLITKAPPLEEEVDSELALKTEEFYSREYLLFCKALELPPRFFQGKISRPSSRGTAFTACFQLIYSYF